MPVFPSEQRSTKCSIMATVCVTSGQTAELGGVLVCEACSVWTETCSK